MASPTSPSPPTVTLVVNPNPQLQAYYSSLEPRLGYRLLLNNTRHFGYYPHETYFPFPLSTTIRALEDHLASLLSLPPGSHVALRLASTHGLRITGIDIVDHQLAKARRNIPHSGLQSETVTVQKIN